MAPALIPLLLIGGGIAGGMLISGAMNRQASMPSISAGQPTVTAGPPDNQLLTEQEKTNKRMAASLLTKDWSQSPKLSKSGLLGL